MVVHKMESLGILVETSLYYIRRYYGPIISVWQPACDAFANTLQPTGLNCKPQQLAQQDREATPHLIPKGLVTQNMMKYTHIKFSN